jgi:hypothetical protein
MTSPTSIVADSVEDLLTAIGSTEGADQNLSILGCFQRIPNISVSSAPIHMKPILIYAELMIEYIQRHWFKGPFCG